jgi:murein DD-endopeptidase MepM/ murein hydrolase activator NlpD
MPPGKFKFQPGEKVGVGQEVGEVGNYRTKDTHLHYEVWENRKLPGSDKDRYIPLDPRTVDLSGYQKRK